MDATASAQVERQSAVGSKAPSEIGAGGKQKKGDQTKLVQGLKVVYDKISQKGISSRSKDSKAKSEEPPTRDAKAKDDGSDGGQLVDIVAVPGLGADPKWSWIKREKINSKPSDKTDPGNAETEKFKEGPSCIEDKLMLQAEVPNSRIMVFHYASQWWGEGAVSQRLEQVADNLVQALKNKRKECPRRPILFIGHSLGGVIIEKVVCRAKLRGNDFHDVYSSIAGCVFLGTPFTGSASQAKAACVAKGGEFLGKATYNSLLKLMENDGDHLKALLEDFLLLVDEAGIQTHCFFELQESNLTKFISSISFLSWAKCSELIAGFDTATLQGRPKTSLNLDHFNLNKFGSPRDEHWIAIHCEIKKMANKAYKIVKGRQNALPEKLDDSKFQEIMEALTLGESAPEKDISRVAKERRDAIHATAKLVLGNEKIQEWLADEEQGLLWISTQPGMDTAMMSVAIQRKLLEIKKDIGSDKAEAHICYFFCNDTDTKKNNTLSILKALVKQLIAQTKKLALHLPLEQKSQSARISYDTVFDLAPPFQAMLRDDSIGTVYILINSLHEVDEDSRRDLLALIDDSLPLSEDGARIEGKVTVKWICVGINRPDIEQTMRKAEHITPEDIGSSKELQNALKSLVRDRVVDLAEKLKYRKDLVFWLRTEITERAEGNATWVDLACGEIQSVSPKPINVRSFVEQLRQGLTPLYKQIQRRVLHTDYQDLEHTKEILRTMMIVVHHPTLEELAILADLPEEARNDSKKIKPYIARCGSFLRIKKDQMNKKLSRVEFMDTSAKNYLKENAAEVLGLSKKLLTQHGILALRCLIYLQEHPQANAPLEEDEEDDDDDDDDSDSNSDSEDEDEDGEESDNKDKGTAENDKGAAEIDRVHAEDENAAKTENLYRGNIAVTYPSKFWIDHAKAATSDVVEDFGLDQIFWNDETMSQMPWWPRLTELTKEYPNLTKLTPMHLAAFFDFRPLLQELLSEWSKHKDQIRAQDSIGREPLYWAAREGHLESVMLLVKHGADVSATSHNNKTGVTVLHGAVEGGCVDVVKFLVKNGAIVDVPNKRLGTALCTAAAKGHTDVVKYLLDAGAKLDAPAGYPYGNAVGAACSRGNTEIVQLLVDNGCSVNVRNEDKKYPLVKAIEAEILELVSLFLSHDANVESRQEALDVAARRNYPEAVELLIKNSTDLNINDAFLQAVTYGNHELFRYFAHDHLDPKVLEKALYTASHMEEEETVKILLGMKADPNAQGEEYGNALQAAAYDGSVGIVRLLLEAGANPNMVGGDYGTALQAAAFQGDTDNIGLLLDAGAETNAGPVGMFGNALYAAVVGNNKQAAELLLERGANVNAHGGDLGFALLAATDEAHLDIMEMLLLHGADANARTEDGVTPLILAASTLPMAALKTLLDHGANINAADENGVTALIAVADTGDTESTELLLERGANVNTMEPNRGSALQIAASNGDEESCEVLLKYGASVNILGGKYQTALQAGAYGGHLDLVETLLDRGAETSITGGFYGSALNAAASTDNTDIINILIETADDSMRDEALHYAVHYKQREAAELLLTNNANVLTTKKWGSILQALEKPITEDEENSDDETDDSDEDEDDDDMDDDDDDDEESDWWGDDDEDEDEDEEGLPANDDLVKSSVKPAFLETEDQDEEGHQWKGVAIGEGEEGELHGEKYGDSDGDGGGMDEEKGKASSDTEPDGENLGHADSVVEDEEQNIQDLRDILEKAIDEAGGLPSAPVGDGSTARFALNKRPVGSTVPPPPSATKKSEMDDATSQGTSDTDGENQPVLPSQPLDASNANGSTPSISRTSLSYSFDGASSTPAQPPEPRTLTADDQLQNTSIIGARSPQRALGGLFQPSDTSLDAAQPDPTSNAELTSKRSRFKNMMGKTARQSANLIRSDETKEMFSKTVGIFKDKTKNMNKIFGVHGPDRDVLDGDGLDEDE